MPWIESQLATLATVAVGLFVVVNGAFIAALVMTRDRRVVDRWTKPLLMTDAALLVTAFATPVVGLTLKVGSFLVSTLAAIPATLLPGK
ncbi:MAG: hypothetical protein SFU84_02610 [Gemmatimonadales bacterium]|nr:hypothetical protein [Gemmatimonadales bacterium]